MMEHMKKSVESEWQATDLGEPSKIISIEVTIMPGYLRISQGKYIENHFARKIWLRQIR